MSFSSGDPLWVFALTFLYSVSSLISLSGITVLMTDFHDGPSNFRIYPSLIFIPFSYYTFEISFKDFTVFFTYSTYIYSLSAFCLFVFVFVTTYSGFMHTKYFILLRILIMLLEVFLFFSWYFLLLPFFFFFLCLWLGQCSHISRLLNLRVLKLKNTSQQLSYLRVAHRKSWLAERLVRCGLHCQALWGSGFLEFFLSIALGLFSWVNPLCRQTFFSYLYSYFMK